MTAMLFDTHKQLLREMVAAAKETKSHVFWDLSCDDGCTLGFGLMGPVKKHIETQLGTYHDIENSAFVEYVGGDRRKLTDAAFAAVESDFAPPPPPAPAVVHNTITVQGNVTGSNIAQGQNITIQTSKAMKLLEAVRQAAQGDEDALEQVENISDELKTGQPLGRRLKGFIAAAHATAIENASLVSALSALATALGLATWFQKLKLP